MHLKPLHLIAFSVLMLNSCESECQKCVSQKTAPTEHSETSPTVLPNQPTPINTDELLKGLGGKAFTIKLPDDLPETFYVGLALEHGDGTVKEHGRISCEGVTEPLRVFIFNKDNSRELNCKIITSTMTYGTTIDPGETTGHSYNPSNTFRAPGEGLMRFSNDDEVSSGGALDPSDWQIVFKVYTKLTK